MNKTKYMLIGFAIFAATIMLMAPCMARPVTEKTSIDAIEKAQRELSYSLESIKIKLSRDYKANALIKSIQKDSNVVNIVNNMQEATTEEELVAGLKELIVVLQDNPELVQLGDIIEQECSYELGVASQHLQNMNDLFVNDDENLLMIIIAIISFIITWILCWILDLLGLFGDDDGGDTPPL